MDRSESEIVAAALTVYGEGRGEPRVGQVAITWSLVNRARATVNGAPRWWGGPDLVSVCQHPAQYDAWNPNDPNGRILAGAFACLTAGPARPVLVAGFDLKAYVACRAVVLDVLERRAADPFASARLYGVTHYTRLEVQRPWMRAPGVVELGRIGAHKFFAGVL